MQDDGLIPEAAVEWCNTKAKELMKKTGFVEWDKQIKLFSVSNRIAGNTVFNSQNHHQSCTYLPIIR